MQRYDVSLPSLQVQQQCAVSLMNTGHQAHPWQTESVDPADAAAEQKQFEFGAGALKGVELVVVVLVINDGDTAEQTEENGERKDRPVKAKNGRSPAGGRGESDFRGAAAGALQVEGCVGLVKDPAMARQRKHPNAKPIALKALEEQRDATIHGSSTVQTQYCSNRSSLNCRNIIRGCLHGENQRSSHRVPKVSDQIRDESL